MHEESLLKALFGTMKSMSRKIFLGMGIVLMLASPVAAWMGFSVWSLDFCAQPSNGFDWSGIDCNLAFGAKSGALVFLLGLILLLIYFRKPRRAYSSLSKFFKKIWASL